MEKTAAKPPWKTLRVSHFPTASTATEINLEVLCSKPKTRRKSHYPWTKNGGQVTIISGVADSRSARKRQGGSRTDQNCSSGATQTNSGRVCQRNSCY